MKCAQKTNTLSSSGCPVACISINGASTFAKFFGHVPMQGQTEHETERTHQAGRSAPSPCLLLLLLLLLPLLLLLQLLRALHLLQSAANHRIPLLQGTESREAGVMASGPCNPGAIGSPSPMHALPLFCPDHQAPLGRLGSGLRPPAAGAGLQMPGHAAHLWDLHCPGGLIHLGGCWSGRQRLALLQSL